MRNILRNADHEQIMERFVLTPQPGLEKKIFATYRDFLCFLAVLGFQHKIRKPLGSNTIGLDSRPFSDYPLFLDLLYLLALAETRNGEILLPKEDNEETCLTIFEEYVEGGVSILEQWLNEMPDDPYGDKAILEALRKRGYLQVEDTPTDPVMEVVF